MISSRFSRGAQGQEIARELIQLQRRSYASRACAARISPPCWTAPRRKHLIHRDNLIITAAEALKDP